MAWSVAWTDAAWEDLAAAADFIARDSPHYAASFVRETRGRRPLAAIVRGTGPHRP